MSEYRQQNIDRFLGFADLYHQYRPKAPTLIADILIQYLGRRPHCVVDVGCGTGLSTFLWENRADRVLGVEPNASMRQQAIMELEHRGNATDNPISFVAGYSHELPCEDQTVDLITCSQSFHWMEPVATLKEAARVLRPGGIFATFDCDWPPSVTVSLEQAYLRFMNAIQQLENERIISEDRVLRYHKDQHLLNIRQSGHFTFTKEIVLHHGDLMDADAFIGMAMSQGSVQTAIKEQWEEALIAKDQFVETVKQELRDQTLSLVFSYRMRIGVK